MIWILIVSGLGAASSFLAEFGFGMTPCHLCLIQRWLHLALFAGAALCLVTKRKLFAGACLILLTASVLVATYHTFVQLGFLQDRCKTNIRITDLASYKAAIEAPLPCKESWRVGNIPVSAINALAASLLILTLIKRKKS